MEVGRGGIKGGRERREEQREGRRERERERPPTRSYKLTHYHPLKYVFMKFLKQVIRGILKAAERKQSKGIEKRSEENEKVWSQGN